MSCENRPVIKVGPDTVLPEGMGIYRTERSVYVIEPKDHYMMSRVYTLDDYHKRGDYLRHKKDSRNPNFGNGSAYHSGDFLEVQAR